MTDIVSSADRSRMMSGIRSRNSLPEMWVRRLLHASGYRFRLHRRDLPGTPDIVMPGRKIAIFVHGCFWHSHHGCRFVKMPATRTDFWKTKLAANVERDRRSMEELRELGWRVLCVWECTLRGAETAAGLQDGLRHWIESDSQRGEISGTMCG
ncbi:DNA mismatch endonuclease Vsr [Verminephrobacter aporrectodeae subsp. tuberculatae]|uniref:very short patch repair endonuclease n=1 Tax=Verminephrobacter aporrectodeae TaxID=1110389 RepID=UPI0022438D55|nr:DNA mismatch endonuclease Vsr [Verminephrobacter aporrectodeae]MCW8207916.1 DNA mismatch endonuclease Vsr [Verminephrobacter aporrectodeae subsp. tuberculatae]